MAETFDPIKFRHLARGGKFFTDILPLSFHVLTEVDQFSRENGIVCGNGINALAKVATGFLDSGSKSFEDAIARDYSLARGLSTRLQLGEISLRGEEERPKKVSEYSEQELERWSGFLNGIDPDDSCITRGTAIVGLECLQGGMNSRVGAVSKYSLSPGEDRATFERARGVLLGTPCLIAKTVLPDLNADEANKIFHIRPDQHPELVKEFAARAQDPIFEVLTS